MSEIVENNQPLTDKERDLLLAEVDGSSIFDRIAVLGILFTGLDVKTLSHASKDWIQFSNDTALITVQSERCGVGDYLGKGVYSRASPRSYGNSTCYWCEQTDGVFRPEYPRVVPVKDKRAVKTFKEWFSLYERVGTEASIRRHIGDVGSRCGISRLSPSVLKHTFAVMLVERGFSRSEIRMVLPMNSDFTRNPAAAKYGEYVEGENPFRCLATRHDGRTCQRWVRQGDRCRFHADDSDLCGYPTGSGHCETPVVPSSERCIFHRDDANTCEAETADGEECSRLVSTENELCPAHSSDGLTANDGEYRCGVKASTTGEPCTRQVSGPGERCPWHAESHDLRDEKYICGAAKSRGSVCEQVVESGEENCRWHTGPTCGAELSGKRKGTCSERVESEDERCSKHSDE